MESVSKVKVFGVGGAGCRLAGKIAETDFGGVGCYAVDDDYSALKISKCENKIQIKGGSRAGADFGCCRETALENSGLFKDAVKGADLVVITAGLGGGMGSAAAPVIANIAKDEGILTVAVVCTPLRFEGAKRLVNSAKGLASLRNAADTVIVISGDKIADIIPNGAPPSAGLEIADEAVINAIRTVVIPAAVPSIINLDFSDLKTVVENAGRVHFGYGYASGENRARAAAEAAVYDPTSDVSLAQTDRMILMVEGGDLQYDEVEKVINFVRDAADYSAKIIFSVVTDSGLNNGIGVFILAARRRDADEEEAEEPDENPLSTELLQILNASV
ncbi:MAG: cell division FtsZ family protein, partial [Clostridia bacterium]|nr:cell division FtsZ family protein [Clostridia bacterium]